MKLHTENHASLRLRYELECVSREPREKSKRKRRNGKKYYMIACNSAVERNSNPNIKVQKQEETLKIKRNVP